MRQLSGHEALHKQTRFAGDALEVHTQPGEIASIHQFLDQGKTGYVNDDDATHYLHKGGSTFSAPSPKGANPIPGGAPGARELQDLDERDYQQFDQIHRQLQHEKMFGPPGMA